jgi:phosphoribosylglycinamide formyltransferase, formyltetrahydrofolate-dependent
MLKVAVLVSGGGTNLQAIFDKKDLGFLPSVDIALVLSNKADAYALERAKQRGIEALVLEKEKGQSRAEYGERLIQALKQRQIKFVVLAGFLVILPENFISAFESRIINVHPSLIPSFCGDGFYGLKVHQAALDYGVKVTGATVHYVNAVTDGGKIIAQRAVDILPDDTAETLQHRVMVQAEWELLPMALEACCKGEIECKSKI